MFVICGIFVLTVPLVGYAIPLIRNVEDILPDHDATPSEAAAGEAEH